MGKMADYGGDSYSLTALGEEPFTIEHVEDSSYTDEHGTKPGVRITTKEEFKIDGVNYHKFHTTRNVLVKTLTREDVRRDINDDGNPLGPVWCKKVQPKGKGQPYYIFEDLEAKGADATPAAEKAAPAAEKPAPTVARV